jgi:hypothetical protein
VPPALPFPDSLCHRCRYLHVVTTKRGSVFLQCREPSLPKYTGQPVRACAAFTAGVSYGASDEV